MKYLSILFALFVAAIVVLADLNAIPPIVRKVYDFPNGDKLGHLVLFGLLNFFLTSAFLPRFTLDRKRIALSIGLILALVAAAEEWSQQFFSARTFDLADLMASFIGVAVGGRAAMRLKK